MSVVVWEVCIVDLVIPAVTALQNLVPQCPRESLRIWLNDCDSRRRFLLRQMSWACLFDVLLFLAIAWDDAVTSGMTLECPHLNLFRKQFSSSTTL
jgi:hypothetical protein